MNLEAKQKALRDALKSDTLTADDRRLLTEALELGVEEVIKAAYDTYAATHPEAMGLVTEEEKPPKRKLSEEERECLAGLRNAFHECIQKNQHHGRKLTSPAAASMSRILAQVEKELLALPKREASQVREAYGHLEDFAAVLHVMSGGLSGGRNTLKPLVMTSRRKVCP